VVGRRFCDCGWWNRSPDRVETVRQGVLQAAAGATFRCETPYFLADGSERIVDLVIAPIRDARGQVVFLAPTGVDVTDRRRAEEQARRLAVELSEADRRRNEFLATLAHELRSPLAPLRYGLELMRVGADEAAVVAKARTAMERQLAHMVHLVNDLADATRVATGRIVLQRRQVELAEVLDMAVESSLPHLRAKGHELQQRVALDGLRIDVDPVRLAQVVSNLLDNAAKYTGAGGRIELAAWHDAREAVIEVGDNGIGIPADALESVFDLFVQVQADHGGRDGGLGIGLNLVRRLVALHGGSVRVASTPGQGSRFSVRLPLDAGTRAVA
jgi:signal transduction histidine kinase